MNIVHKFDAKTVKHRLYRINMRVEDKKNKDIDKMLMVGVIFPVNKDE